MNEPSAERTPLRRQAGQVDFLGSFVRDLPDTGLPEVAFAGRSNVGKSSALNVLLNRKIARVSGTPGRTQTINLFQVGRGAVFADLPGYGFAKVPEAILAQWGPMIEGYLGEREALRLVVVLIDGSLPAQGVDGALLEGLRAAGLRCLVVATKVDRLPKHQRKPALTKLREAHDLPPGEPVAFSATTKEGLDLLWDRLEAACRR